MYIQDLITKAEKNPTGSAKDIQRAHRSGQANSSGKKPRPIHVGFHTHTAKETAKKSLIHHFKESGEKLFISDDYSRKIQAMRKEKLPQLKESRKQGKNGFLIYPAKIKVRDDAGHLVDL